MAAEKGNQHWSKRSKHGRDKIFATPEAMLQAFEEYVDYVKNRRDYDKVKIKKNVLKPDPLDVIDFAPDEIEAETKTVGSEEHTIEQTLIPLTLGGFALFIGAHTKYLTSFLSSLDPKDGKTEDFIDLIEAIKEEVLYDQINGAISGVYKENIVARINGINDGIDTNIGSVNKKARQFFSQDGKELDEFD